MFLRERRHALLDAACQDTLAAPAVRSLAAESRGRWGVGPRDAGALLVMDKRWQRGLAGLGAEPPPFSPGTLFHVRLRLMTPNLDKTLGTDRGAGGPPRRIRRQAAAGRPDASRSTSRLSDASL